MDNGIFESDSKRISKAQADKVLSTTARCTKVGFVFDGDIPHMVFYKGNNHKKPALQMPLLYILEAVDSYMETMPQFAKNPPPFV